MCNWQLNTLLLANYCIVLPTYGSTYFNLAGVVTVHNLTVPSGFSACNMKNLGMWTRKLHSNYTVGELHGYLSHISTTYWHLGMQMFYPVEQYLETYIHVANPFTTIILAPSRSSTLIFTCAGGSQSCSSHVLSQGYTKRDPWEQQPWIGPTLGKHPYNQTKGCSLTRGSITQTPYAS